MGSAMPMTGPEFWDMCRFVRFGFHLDELCSIASLKLRHGMPTSLSGVSDFEVFSKVEMSQDTSCFHCRFHSEAMLFHHSTCRPCFTRKVPGCALLVLCTFVLLSGNAVDSVQAIQVLPGSALTLSSALVGIEWPRVASFTVHNGEVECQSI